MSSENSDWVAYTYTPTRVGGGIAAALFGTGVIVLVVEIYYFARKPTSGLQFASERSSGSEKEGTVIQGVPVMSGMKNAIKYLPLLVGSAMEAVGYAARAVSSSDTSALTPYIIQSILLLVAPALIAATIYMLFGRMLVLLRCTSLSIVPSRFNTILFVVGDVFSFFLQAAGGGLMSQEGSTSTGSKIVVAGLFVQIVFFGLFFITEVRFSFGVNSVSPVLGRAGRTWKVLNWGLLVSSLLILVRSVVRVVEFIQGFDGYIRGHEVFIYVFDAVPIFLVVLLFALSMPFGSLFRLEDECL